MLIPLTTQPAPYKGSWAENPAWCGRTRSEGDEIPTIITRHAIEQFASLCIIRSVKRRKAGWRLETLRRDEGDEKEILNTFILSIKGGKLYMRDASGLRSLTRCLRAARR